MLNDGEDGYSQEQEKSEYERFLKLGQGGPGKADQPLKWWKVSLIDLLYMCIITGSILGSWTWVSDHSAHCTRFLGYSVCVEHLFSGLRHLCTDLRGSLKAETVTEAMCAKQWLRDGLFSFFWCGGAILNISCYFPNHIFNINCLNGFHLPFPYKYWFVVYENEMVGALGETFWLSINAGSIKTPSTSTDPDEGVVI